METNYEKDLQSMGYRLMGIKKWGKPVGFHLFVVEIDLLRWTNWFKGNNEKLLIWDSNTLENSDYKDFLLFLKSCESLTKIYNNNSNSKFEFLSTKEYLETIL